MTRTTLVLLPGLDGTGQLFAPLLPYLDASEVVHCVYGPHRNWLDYVAQVESELASHGRVSLLAESFSGPIALELMARRPSRFGPSVLSATFARAPWRSLLALASWLRLSRLAPGALRARLVAGLCLNGVRDRALHARVLEVVLSLPDAVLDARLRALSQMNCMHRLSQVSVRCLCLTGTHDRIIRHGRSRVLAEGLTNRREALLDAPHLLLQAAPEVAARLINVHLAGPPHR
ncbi:MAG: alpha/beta hydrolase [Gammaproteobacteria bacterium]|nr:alpha/beta hydrolase [Gammaproteobacteria bacterium]